MPVKAINYTEEEKSISLRCLMSSGKRQSLDIVLTENFIEVITKQKKLKVDVGQIREIIYSVGQTSVRRGYSNNFQVTGYIYHPTIEDYIEIASFTSIEPQSVLLRDTETFKIAELIVDKISTFYGVGSRYQFEIITSKERRKTSWGFVIMVIVWLVAFGLIIILANK